VFTFLNRKNIKSVEFCSMQIVAITTICCSNLYDEMLFVNLALCKCQLYSYICCFVVSVRMLVKLMPIFLIFI